MSLEDEIKELPAEYHRLVKAVLDYFTLRDRWLEKESDVTVRAELMFAELGVPHHCIKNVILARVNSRSIEFGAGLLEGLFVGILYERGGRDDN